MIRAALPTRLGGLDLHVLFITTVQKFSQRRLDQLLSNYNFSKSELEEIYSKFHIEHLEAQEFDKFLLNIDNYLFKNKIGLVIIDSITGVADVQFIKENNEVDFISRAQFLKRIIALFKEMIFKHNLFFLVTNNMSSNFTTGKNIPNLGLIWENGINTRILLMKKPERVIQINFSNFMEKREANFIISDEGIAVNNFISSE
jgi:hypothetical protein